MKYSPSPRRFLLLAILIAASSLSVGNQQTAKGQEKEEEAVWIRLFDGESVEGWTPRSEVEKFEVVDGELHLLSKTNCWVTTAVEMADFEVECEVKLPEEAGFNSGLAFRCTGAKGKPKGYQCEIDRGKPAGIYGIGLGGWLYPNGETQADYKDRAEGLLKPEDWNHFRVVAVGPRVQTYLNGTLVAEIEDEQSLRGYFGIQHHGKGGTVKFRNIRARKITQEGDGAKGAVEEKGEKGEAGSTRPNILWIVAEDMSPTLGCYGDRFATTPNIDKLAAEGILYTNAFAAAPVCSPSRSCLITGMYPGTMGTEQMRSAFPLPHGVKGFPSFLRDAGYFCTNNEKTDYNNGDAERLIGESWNRNGKNAHWRAEERKAGTPFFAVFNDMTSHQSRTMVWPYAAFQKHVQSQLDESEVHDPEEAPLPPYYPDTPTVRRTMARYYDCLTVMDKNVGKILGELEEDGLADDTIVFFYSDHGSGLPRHKRNLHDSGMRVALVVRFPEKFKHLAPSGPGTVSNTPVSFVDFPQTVLGLAGVAAPEYMQGRPFLGKGAQEREIVYGTRDRVDEVFDTTRSVRDGRFLYIRNYMPHLGYLQPSVFSDLGEIRGDIRQYAEENPEALTGPQRHLTSATRPVEEFYDCKNDPQNLNNLLGGKLTEEQGAALTRLRKTLVEKRAEYQDTGFLPEGEAWNWVRDEGMPLRDIVLGKANHSPDLEAGWAAADLVGLPGKEKELLALLSSPDPSQRYWAIIGLRNTSPDDEDVLSSVSIHIEDVSPDVRIEAAAWLAHTEKYHETSLARLVDDLDHEDWWVALRACRAIELLGKEAESATPVMRKLYDRTRHAKGDENFFLAFSSGAFLEALGEKTDPWDFSPGAGSFSADPKEKKKEE